MLRGASSDKLLLRPRGETRQRWSVGYSLLVGAALVLSSLLWCFSAPHSNKRDSGDQHHAPLLMDAGLVQLVSVTALVRHGARSPLEQQTWENYTWVEGLGELTSTGMVQGYTLGADLRTRYVDLHGLLPRHLQKHRHLVRVHSTEFDRTQETVWALLLGLFSRTRQEDVRPVDCGCRPKEGDMHSRLSSPECVAECIGLKDPQVAAEIPSLRVAPLNRDWLLRQATVCEGFEHRSSDTSEFRRAVAGFEPQFRAAKAFLGDDKLCSYAVPGDTSSGTECLGPPLSMRALYHLYGNLKCAEVSGRPCSRPGAGACRDAVEALEEINEFTWNYDYQGVNAVEHGGMLMGRVLQNFAVAQEHHRRQQQQRHRHSLGQQDASGGNNAENEGEEDEAPPPMRIYGAHDTNVAAMLGTMKVEGFRAPPFAAHIEWELWAPRHHGDDGIAADDGAWVVAVRYGGEPLLGIPGCSGGRCSLRDFKAAMGESQVRHKGDCTWKSKP